MKAIVLIGDKLVGKAIANRTCIRSEEILGSEGVPPGKMFRGHAL